MDQPMQLRLAGVIRESIVDGPGFRFVVFAQGCPHHCPGCHNPETHPFDGGYWSDTARIMTAVKQDSLLSGLTFSGGEPFCQAAAFTELARLAHAQGLNVISYTGYTFEELYAGFDENPAWRDLLEELDILVDGRFLIEQKTLNLKFRGSANQRVIDPRLSLREGRAIERPFEGI